MNCEHKNWEIRVGDETVTELPAGEVLLIHDCEKLKVWQQKGGLKRFYKNLDEINVKEIPF